MSPLTDIIPAPILATLLAALLGALGYFYRRRHGQHGDEGKRTVAKVKIIPPQRGPEIVKFIAAFDPEISTIEPISKGMSGTNDVRDILIAAYPRHRDAVQAVKQFLPAGQLAKLEKEWEKYTREFDGVTMPPSTGIENILSKYATNAPPFDKAAERAKAALDELNAIRDSVR